MVVSSSLVAAKKNGAEINLSSIWSELLQDDKNLDSKLTTSPLMLTMDSSSAINHSDYQENEIKDEIFNTQDREFISGKRYWDTLNSHFKQLL